MSGDRTSTSSSTRGDADEMDWPALEAAADPDILALLADLKTVVGCPTCIDVAGQDQTGPCP